MKSLRKKLPKFNKLMVYRVLSLAVILLGAWLLLSNLYHFSKGYFAYRTISANEQSDKSSSKNSADTGESVTKEVNQSEANAIISNQKQKEAVLYPERPKTGDDIGELTIPKLKVALPIYEGTEEDELEKGVGHFADSVLPGEIDNCVLSGHRDTVFRKLGEVGKGDLLIVKTSAGEFKYRVNKVRIVKADDRTVIVPKPRATLTVSTCYPFDYIGSAPKRYILVAYLVEKTLY